MKRKYLILVLLSYLLYTNACKKDDSMDNPEPYFTFGKVGNVWTYERVRIDHLLQDTIIDTIKFTINDYIINNVYACQYITNDYHRNFTWFISSDSFGSSEDTIFVKKDSKKGDLYTNCYVMEIDESLNILNESIICFKVQTSNNMYPDNSITWINSQYGVVKFFRESHSAPGVSVSNKSTLINKNF